MLCRSAQVCDEVRRALKLISLGECRSIQRYCGLLRHFNSVASLIRKTVNSDQFFEAGTVILATQATSVRECAIQKG